MKLKKTFVIFIILLNYSQFTFCQKIIEEGKGIDSLTLGVKESKIINFLGQDYTRKKIDDFEFILEFKNRGLSFAFDQDSVVYEIWINPKVNFRTKKGLLLTSELRIVDVEKVYGVDWWSTKENNYIAFDIGIKFEIKDDVIQKVIIEESDLKKGNDYSFYEYLEGIYIPKNLDECYIELNTILDKKKINEIKLMSEKEFTINSHFELGLWLRNNWGLWKGTRLYNFFKTKGILHPDDISGIILTSYHRYLNENEINLEQQIKFYKEYWDKQKKE